MKKLFIIGLIVFGCTQENITVSKPQKALSEKDIHNQIALRLLSLVPGDTLQFVVVSGQSNAANYAFTNVLNGYPTWNDNTERLDTVLSKAQFLGNKMGPLYYLAQKLKAKFPNRKIIFFQFNKASTLMIGNTSSNWNPFLPYNLTYNLFNNIRDVVDAAGVPTVVDFIWFQGESDLDSTWKTYLTYEKQLYDSLPRFLKIPETSVRYHTSVLKDQNNVHYQDSINYAKRLHASIDSRIKMFEIPANQYSGIHMTQALGIKTCADTLARHIK